MYDSFSVAPKRIFPSQVKWANFLSPPLFNSHTFSPLLSEKVNLYNTHIPRIATFANTLKKNHQMAFYSIFSNGEKFCREKIKRLSGAVMDEEDVYKDAGAINGLSRPLSAIAEAFEKLSDSVKAANGSDLRLEPFCDACSLVSVLFGCLGVAFKFAEMEYVSKVRDLSEASTIYGTLNKIVDYDVKNDTVKTQGSLTRNLRRVRQGLDLIRALFQNFLSTDECSLKDAASTAYAQVCAPYHTWAVRTAVSAGMCALPTRDQLLLKLNETDESAEKEMRRYIKASIPVIKYIDNLYISRNITLDW